jgi:GAF domain-containing protein/CheY-like chemotaxis protein
MISQKTNTPHLESHKLQSRTTRGFLLLIFVAFVVVGLVAMLIIRANARDNLQSTHQVVLSALMNDLNSDLANFRHELTTLASGDTVRRYAFATVDPGQELARRNDVLTAFLSLLESRLEIYMALRYVAPDGAIRSEAISTLQGARVFDVGSGRYIYNDRVFNSVVNGETRLGGRTFVAQTDALGVAVDEPYTVFQLSIPISFIEGGDNILGVIQADIRAPQALSEITSAPDSPLLAADGRRFILFDGQLGVLADSATPENAQSIDNITAFLQENPNPFSVAEIDGLLVSSTNLSGLAQNEAAWRLVLVDDAGLIMEASNSVSVLIMLVSAVLGLGATLLAALLMRRAVAPLDYVAGLARGLVGEDQAAQLPIVPGASGNSDIEQAISKIGERLEGLSSAIEEQRNRTARDLEIVSQISRETAMLHDLDTLVTRAIDLICSEFNFYHAQVFLVDDIGKDAVLVYSHGELGKQLLAQGHKLAVGSDSVIGQVTSSRVPVILNNIHNTNKHAFNPILSKTQAEMALPLQIGSEIIGALDIQSEETEAFQPDDVQVFQLLADQLAIAIYNARLLMESSQRVYQIDSLNRQLTRDVWQDAEQRFGLERVYHYDLRQVIAEVPQGKAEAQNAAKLTVPIQIRNEVIGELDIAMPEGADFSEGDQSVVRAVVDRVGLALENARLFHETQESLAETSMLYEMNRLLNEAESLEGILEAICTVVVPDTLSAQIMILEEDFEEENVVEDAQVVVGWVAEEYRDTIPSYSGQYFAPSEIAFMEDLRTRRFIVTSDVANDPRLKPRWRETLPPMGIHGLALVPLNMRGMMRGIFVFNFPAGRTFDERDGRIFSALIDQAGVAVDNRLLLLQTEDTLDLRERMYAASRGVNTSQSVKDLIFSLLQTSSDPDLTFSMSLLEGRLDEHGWGTAERLVAQSEGNIVQERDEIYPIYVRVDSPMRSREPEVFVGDKLLQSEELSPLVTRLRDEGQRFIAVFPLFSTNQPVAFLYVSHKQMTDLEQADYEFYVALTGQMSTVLQNRRLLEQTAQALDETRRLYEASRAISAAQDMDEVYDIVGSHVSDAAPRMDRLAIIMMSPEASKTAPYADYAYTWTHPEDESDWSKRGTYASNQVPYLELVMKVGQRVLLGNPSQDLHGEPLLLAHLEADEVGSLIVTPIVHRDRWFGVLVCHSSKRWAFDEQLGRFVQATADQVAIAAENRLLFAEAQQEAQRALALAEVGQLATRIGTEFEQNIYEAFTMVSNVAGYDRWLLMTRPNNPNDEWVVFAQNMPDRIIPEDDYAMIKDAIVSAARLGEIIAINEPELEDAFNCMGGDGAAYVGKNIIAPIQVGSELQGALLVGRSMTSADLTPYDVRLIETLAAQITVAMENLRLFREAEAERETLSSILETLPAGVLVLDAETQKPLQSNIQMENLLGKPVLNEPFSAAMYNLYQTGMEHTFYDDAGLPILKAQETGELASSDDLMVLHEDGTRIDLLMNAAPIRNSRGKVTSIVAVFENISSLRGLEDALQENLRSTIALYEATRIFAEADSSTEVLDTLITMLSQFEPLDAAVLLVHEQTGELFVSRQLMEDNGPDVFLRAAPALSADRPLMNVNVMRHPAFDDETRAFFRSQGIGAFTLSALETTTREEPMGWLILAHDSMPDLSGDEDRFITTLASSGATSLDNQYLFQSTQAALNEASILYQASRALSAAKDEGDILSAVVDFVVKKEISQVFIILLDDKTWEVPDVQARVVRSWINDPDMVDLTGVSIDAEQFPAWSLMASDNVLTIENAMEATDLAEIEQIGLSSLGVTALAILPLRVGARDLGAIWLGSGQPVRFTERDVRIYQSFAEQTSITIEAARLFEQAERRARQLEISTQVSQIASSILDLDQLLNQVVNMIKSAFGYDHVQFFLMDREDRFAVLQASTGDAGKKLLSLNHKLEKGSASVIGAVTAEARPVIALDTGTADVMHRPNPHLPQTRSEMALPLIIKGKVVGALDVQSNRPKAFGPEDVSVLTTLAAQISTAIDNARLFEQAEQRASDMTFLFAVTTAAASAESLAGALQNVTEDLRDSMDALSVSIYLPVVYIDEITEATYTRLRVEALSGLDQPLSEIEEVVIGDANNIIGIAAETFRSYIINRIEDEPLYLPLSGNAQSSIVVPLTSGSQLIGVVTMENADTYAFNRDTQTLLEILGGTLTAIIENAQLLEQVQQSNEQLRELDRVKSEFLANMSHELRTPLNSIIGFSRVILKGIDGPLTEMQEQDLTTIYNSGQHLLNLINDILDQAKIAANKMELQTDYFDIKAVVEGVRSIGIGLVKEKPIDIRVNMASGLPQVYGDEFRTRQVLLNIVSNATKFTREGSITLSVYPDKSQTTGKPMVRIDIADTGIGIAEKDVPLLFEAFRQIDSSLTRTAGGTGLGLPISKSLIEMQGGEMMLSSEVNVGSTFSVTIPIHPADMKLEDEDTPSTETESSPALAVTGKLPALDENFKPVGEAPVPVESSSNGQSHNGQQDDDTVRIATNTEKRPATGNLTPPIPTTTKRQVLLIEDKPDRVDQFRRVIQREGFDVFTASIPLEAEAMASGLRPTLIIIDGDFAGGKGWDIIQKLKERDDTFDIPVIVTSLSDREEDARDAGAFAYFQHPIMPEELTEMVVKAAHESSRDRILIIDDQPESTRLLKQLLDEHGNYRVFSAQDGVEGVSLVARRRPDLIILDLRMPEMDGFAVLQELRSNSETENIPVIVVTGDTLDSAEQSRLAGVDVLSKTDISLQNYNRFIHGITTHLSQNGE